MGKQGKEKPLKLVLDTNTLISGILWNGNEARLLGHIDNGRAQLYFSEEMISEFENVAGRSKFGDLLLKAGLSVGQIVEKLLSVGFLLVPERKIRAIEEDPDDNKFLECAVEAEADYIVSGDSHLLKLREFEGIPIVRTKDILKKFE